MIFFPDDNKGGPEVKSKHVEKTILRKNYNKQQVLNK